MSALARRYTKVTIPIKGGRGDDVQALIYIALLPCTMHELAEAAAPLQQVHRCKGIAVLDRCQRSSVTGHVR